MTHHTILSRPVRIVCSAALLAAVIAAPASAQDATPGKIDAKATGLLQGMSDYLAKEKTISFRARTFFDAVQESGIKVKVAREVEISKDPDHISATTLDDAGGSAAIWYDGAKLTVWRRTDNQFMTLDFAGGTDKLLDELTDTYDFQIPLADLLYTDINKALGGDIISSEYVGLRNVDGVPCHQLSFESGGADWQIWIEADATPVPRRYVIDFVTEENKPQFMANLDAWSLGGTFEDFTFKAAMPEGVKQVEFGKAAAAPK